jgi:hypothetical protein
MKHLQALITFQGLDKYNQIKTFKATIAKDGFSINTQNDSEYDELLPLLLEFYLTFSSNLPDEL